MDITPYHPKHRAACLEILNSLTPHLINSAQESQFKTFLDTLNQPFFIIEHDNEIAACGGYAITPHSDTAELKWGMVRDNLRKKGLGRFLLLYRIREIAKTNTIATVAVETSLTTAPFFQKEGFRIANSDNESIRLTKRLSDCP
jgi:[ribosomal protein S18]-alanine N-acetyltransferase